VLADRDDVAVRALEFASNGLRVGVLAAEAVAHMEAHRINTLLVVDAQGVLVGATTTNDLMRAKVI